MLTLIAMVSPVFYLVLICFWFVSSKLLLVGFYSHWPFFYGTWLYSTTFFWTNHNLYLLSSGKELIGVKSQSDRYRIYVSQTTTYIPFVVMTTPSSFMTYLLTFNTSTTTAVTSRVWTVDILPEQPSSSTF